MLIGFGKLRFSPLVLKIYQLVEGVSRQVGSLGDCQGT